MLERLLQNKQTDQKSKMIGTIKSDLTGDLLSQGDMSGIISE